MRNLTKAMCCALMAFLGYNVINNISQSTSVPQNTLHAATIPSWNYNGPMPLDLQLDKAKRIKIDTVVIHDTVTVTNIKYVRVPVPRHTTDTIYVPLSELPDVQCVAVKNRSPGDREEQSLDESNTEVGIVLIVDGNTVYSSSKNENHSGDNPEGITSADEP